jgi:adenylate kinase family enzyme
MTKSQDPMLIDGFPRTVEQARILHDLMVVEGIYVCYV